MTDKINGYPDWLESMFLLPSPSFIWLKTEVAAAQDILHNVWAQMWSLIEWALLILVCAAFVKEKKDNITHMYWQCSVVHLFWNQLIHEINEKCQNAVNLRISEPLVILGNDSQITIDNNFYFIMLLAKGYVII